MRVARAFESEIESMFVEDEQLFDCAAYGFVREVSLCGRQSRAVSAAGMMHDLQLAAQGARRQLEALARKAEVPLRCRVVRDEPLRALSIACAESGPWNVVALAEPFAGGNGGHAQAAAASRSAGATGLVMVGPRARRVTGPIVVARGGHRALPDLLRAAERLAALDGAEIVLLLIAPDEERLAAWTARRASWWRRARTCASSCATVARGEAAVIAETLRRLQRRLRHLPVRRPGGARRGRSAAAGVRAGVSAVPGAVRRAAPETVRRYRNRSEMALIDEMVRIATLNMVWSMNCEIAGAAKYPTATPGNSAQPSTSSWMPKETDEGKRRDRNSVADRE